MDLSRDNQKIYSIEAEYYKEYMDEENQQAISSRLNGVIKLLLALLLAILAYFTYKIIDGNLVIDEVINKKNIISTFTTSDSSKEVYVEELANGKEPIHVAEKKELVIKEELPKVETPQDNIVKKVIEEIKVVETPKVIEVPTVSKIEVVERAQPVEVTKVEKKTPSKVVISKDSLLSDDYLDAMMSEMNK